MTGSSEVNERGRSNTLQAVQRLLADRLELDPAKLDPAVPLEELGIDSLTLTECIFNLEDEFSISMQNSEVKPNTLQEIADLIDRVVAAKDAGSS